jgi:hypothetical protein
MDMILEVQKTSKPFRSLRRNCRRKPQPRGQSEADPDLPIQLVVADRLTERHLIDLAEGRYLAVRIPRYYPVKLCIDASKRIIGHPRYGTYENAPIKRAGMAFFETVGGHALLDRYYQEAMPAISDLRQVFDPNYSPMDRLRLEVQERWPHGAPLLSLDGRQMFVGLCRVFEDGGEALPHQDVLRRDAPDCARAHELITQLAANIYLNTSGRGGELEIWQEKFSDSEYEAFRLPGSYGLDRAKIPPPGVVTKPRVGDLIIFNANHIHAVRGATNGARVTISCFIGYRGRNQPLCFWS